MDYILSGLLKVKIPNSKFVHTLFYWIYHIYWDTFYLRVYNWEKKICFVKMDTFWAILLHTANFIITSSNGSQTGTKAPRTLLNPYYWQIWKFRQSWNGLKKRNSEYFLEFHCSHGKTVLLFQSVWTIWSNRISQISANQIFSTWQFTI